MGIPSLDDPFTLRSQQRQVEDQQAFSSEDPFSSRAQQRIERAPLSEKIIRTAMQLPMGLAEGTNIGLAAGMLHFLGMGEVFDPEEIDRIKAISEREGVKFDEEKYRESAQNALDYFPTVSNIGREVESATGIPLTPQEGYQKLLRLGSMAGKATPGAASQKLTAGVTAPTVSGLTQAGGLPEPFADILGLGAAGITAGLTPKAQFSLTKTKPSGLPERGFESLTKTRQVTPGKLNQINKKLESDFRKVSDEIVKDSPVGETAKNLAENPAYKQESKELLDQAQQIADSLPDIIPTKSLKKELADISVKRPKGVSLSEYDKNYLKYMKEAINDVVAENASLGELVEQYRKNNSSLTEYFEPGASKALNRAKKDALLDQNRAIATLLEKVNPELSEVFKEGNSRWSKIMDYEAMDDFINKVFEKGVDYRDLRNFYDKTNIDRIFKRALGEEGFAKFDQLVKDMMTSENAYKMLKLAKEKGFSDLWKTGLNYILHPKLGVARAGYQSGKEAFKFLMNSMIDKPKLAPRFVKAVQDVKKGKFAEAQKEFETIEAEVLPKEKTETTKKSTETLEVTPEEIKEPSQIESPKKQIEFKEPEKATAKESIKQIEYKPREIPKQENILQKLPETRGKGEIFHGSPNEISDPSHAHYSSLNYYGQGFYTTDALDIASGYASRKGKAKNPTIYKVTEKKPVKLFDMETPIPTEIRKELENLKYHAAIEENLSENPKQTLRELYDNMRDSGYPADEIQEEFNTIARKFEKNGYDGFKHEGGKLTGSKPHEVKIYFTPEDSIKLEKINNPNEYKFKEPEKAVEKPRTSIKEKKEELKKSVSGYQEEYSKIRIREYTDKLKKAKNNLYNSKKSENELAVELNEYHIKEYQRIIEEENKKLGIKNRKKNIKLDKNSTLEKIKELEEKLKFWENKKFSIFDKSDRIEKREERIYSIKSELLDLEEHLIELKRS